MKNMKNQKNTSFKVISSSVIGNAMEWYDYLLYAHFAVIISKLFFPLKDGFYSIMITLAVFAAGFLARPLGGYIFGLIGDNLGRKTALTASILLMAVPTALIGFLPTYQSIGLFAPLIMLIIRILQGISLGGEYSSSTAYLVESAPANKKGFFGSFASMSLALGVLVSALTVLIIEFFFTKEEIYAYAWRIPFLISIIYGMIGFYIRSQLHESDEFKEARKKGNYTRTPFKEIATKYKKNLAIAIGVFMGLTIPFYVIVVFSKTIMVGIGFAPQIATMLNCLLVFVYMATVPIAGFFVDKVGERRILLIGSIGMILFAFPFLYGLKSGDFGMIIAVNIIAGILIGIFQSAVPSFSAKAFPTAVRASGISLSYNIPAIIFGGTAPMIVTYITKLSGGNIIPIGFYLLFGCLFAGITSFLSGFKLKQIEEKVEEVMENLEEVFENPEKNEESLILIDKN
jgi:MHS family proline/betaine transporter-like MFS transporter